MRVVIFIFFLILFCGASGVFVANQAGATSIEGWGGQELSVIAESNGDLPPLPGSSCRGYGKKIMLRSSLGVGTYGGCVYGEISQTRVARYVEHSNGMSAYAIAFPFDPFFSKIHGVCSGVNNCLYNPETDVFFMKHRIPSSHYEMQLHSNFSAGLTEHNFNPVWYKYEPVSEPYEFKTSSGPQVIESSAFSRNGKWGVVEMRSYGIIRINTETKETRRVIAPGATYGHGKDPTYEMAITNDGRHIAVMGQNLGLVVTEVDGTCGDVFTAESDRHFENYSSNCPTAITSRYEMFPDFIVAKAPVFSDDGKRLGATVSTHSGTKRVIISPYSQEPLELGQYLALGDSYTSGEGELSDEFYIAETNSTDNKCHVSLRSYPYLTGNKWGLNTVNAACSGARIQDVLSEGNAQFQQLLSKQPLLVTIGIGGNDAGLMDKLKGCLMPSVCEWATKVELRPAIVQELSSVSARLIDLIDAIKQASPGSKIAVIGYPQIINASNAASCSFSVGVMFNPAERTFIYETIHHLNAVIESTAEAAGIPYANVSDAFNGSALCDATPSSMNPIRLGDDIAPIAAIPQLKVIGAESFHPTPSGHARVAQAITSQLPSAESIVNCVICAPSAGIPEQSDYWRGDENDESPVRKLISQPFIKNNSQKPAGIINVIINKLFSPTSLVEAWVQSNPQKIAQIHTDSNGSINENIVLPENLEPGFHTVHLYGVSRAGDLVDIYTTIWIEGSATQESKPVYLVEQSKQPSLTSLSSNEEAVLGANIKRPQRTQQPENFEKSINEPAKTSPDNRVSWLFGGLIVIGVSFLIYITIMRRGSGQV